MLNNAINMDGIATGIANLPESISSIINDEYKKLAKEEIKMKFRKKPVVIEAYQTDIPLDIETLEGVMHANPGDWIITGVNGEKYPCKPDIFEKTYEPAEEGIMQDLKQESKWIPVTERLPENGFPVNIVWLNHQPESYYSIVKDKPFVATGIYRNGAWYWWSTTTEDYLNEYGECEWDKVDPSIEITYWMPLPEIPKGEDDAE